MRTWICPGLWKVNLTQSTSVFSLTSILKSVYLSCRDRCIDSKRLVH